MHHPDVGGAEESQKLLALVRDKLLRDCRGLPQFDDQDNTTVIGEFAITRFGPWSVQDEITDDDIPF